MGVRSGVKQISSATPIALDDLPCASGWILKAHPDNEGTVQIGGVDDAAASEAAVHFAMGPGDVIRSTEWPVPISSMAEIAAASAVQSNKLCWLRNP